MIGGKRKIILGLIFLAVFGCATPKNQPEKSTDVKEKSKEIDYLPFARKIEDSINSDSIFFREHFDSRGFVKRAIPHFSETRFESVLRGFEKQNKTILTEIGSGVYSFLRLASYQDKNYLFFRFVRDDSALVYVGIEIEQREGSIRIPDVYFFNTTTSASEHVRRLIDSGGGDAKQFSALVKKLERLTSDPENAIKTWASFPENIKSNRVMHSAYISMLAGSTFRVEYEKQFFAYEEKYPSHTSTLFLATDFYFFMKRFPEYYEALDLLEAHFGRDPFLDFSRSTALEEEGKIEEAYGMLKRAINEDPYIYQVWEASFRLSLLLKKFDESELIFKVLTEDFGYEWDLKILKTDTDYEGFRKSPEGSKIIKNLEENNKKKKD